MNFYDTNDPRIYVRDRSSILQSDEWINFQKSLGRTTIKNATPGVGYAYYAYLDKTPIGKYLFVPYGPDAANLECFKSAIVDLKKAAKKSHAFFVRIEPQELIPKKELKKMGAVKIHDIDPEMTWVMEIPETREELLKKVPKRLRGYYNTREKNGISIQVSKNPDDVKYLVEMQAKIFAKKSLHAFSEEYFKKELEQDFAKLYLAWYDSKAIAAILIFDDADTRYYMQAASDKDYEKLNANGILAIQTLLDAQDDGKNFYDFWGVAPEGVGPEHPWYGFSGFKRKFKGEDIAYSGTWDVPILKFRYLVYSVLRNLRKRLRK